MHVQHVDNSIGLHVMQVESITEIYVVHHDNICYGRTCSIGGHVLQVCVEAAANENAVSLGSRCCVFFSYFFGSDTCFPIYYLKCYSWVCRFIFVVCLFVVAVFLKSS